MGRWEGGAGGHFLRRSLPVQCTALWTRTHRPQRSYLRDTPALAGWTVHHPRRSHLRTVLHEISEASDHSEHRVGRLGRELRSSGGVGCSDRTTYSFGAMVDGPLGLRLDSQPFLGASYESCG